MSNLITTSDPSLVVVGVINWAVIFIVKHLLWDFIIYIYIKISIQKSSSRLDFRAQ
jgi:hypothetical protein